MAILKALPPEWSTIWSIILNKTGPFMLQGTINALLEHENTLKRDQGDALFVSQGQKHWSPVPPMRKSNSSSSFVCKNCNQPGHTIEQCWSKGEIGRAHV